MLRRILFVCTGNTCRSPLAEGLGRKHAAEAGCDLEFRSAGVYAAEGQAISAHSEAILREHGVNESFSSRGLTDERVAWADLILTMTRAHKRAVIAGYPQAAEKTYTLKEYVADEAERQRLADLERQIAELQLELSLQQEEEAVQEKRKQLESLWNGMPDQDIADPFGQQLHAYRQCADEIMHCLRKLIG